MKTHSEIGASMIRDMHFLQNHPLVHTAWESADGIMKDGMEMGIRMA